jgi:ketol-acid reductoisomerase
MAKLYHDSDADLGALKGKKIAVLGFGSQGKAQSMCLKDSGLNVVVGLRKDGNSWKDAKKNGMKVAEVADAVKGADVVMVLVPDEVQGDVFKTKIAPNLKPGAALEFAHGFSITFKEIKAPKENDVIMMAPKAPGPMVREMYVQGFGTPALIAVEQDHSGKAKSIALALAKGIGATKAGVIETTFVEEATSDLFGEQVVLCGGVTALVEAGFNTLVKNGYQPEIAYFECLHELKLIVDLFQKGGMMHMWDSVSNTAEYGGLTRRDRVINKDTCNEMQAILDEIRDGRFAKEWMKDAKSGMKKMKKLEEAEAKSKVEVVGKGIRALFETKAPVAAKKPAAKKVAAKPAAKKAPAKKPAAKKAVVKPAAKKAPAKKPSKK